MVSEKPLVLVLGGTGYTGQSVVGGLIKSGNFRVAAFVRPTSVTKPATETLRTAGVEIRVGDFTDDFEKLKQYLHGVDILISAVDAGVVGAQREIFRAAKEVGVQRVVPCDWATPSAKGVILINDLKLEIREYLRDLGVGYTFIDVGWWMQLFLPLPLRSTVGPQVEAMTWRIHGAGENRNLLTDLHNIGTWTAKIIADPRTLNKTVIIWEDEVKEKDAHEIGARVSGDEDRLREKRIQVSEEDIKKQIADGKEAYAQDPNDSQAIRKTRWRTRSVWGTSMRASCALTSPRTHWRISRRSSIAYRSPGSLQERFIRA
ncbi:NAD-P-binding protein [Lentinus tigrinus ALCF2SS1-7]|uniref:NAD-P-binding protein n=1 Tax=Lentinus tigrinus ALCF2SS1-7 TaxID=1328758 RepID=UPI001165D8C3|nr:NAD-P-binding protein [Lentinus tigrinus ALCF2SS1-7]